MNSSCTSNSTSSTLTALARRQGGVVLRRQAQQAGLTRDQVRGLVQRGRWQALHQGVYLTGGFAPDRPPPLLARLWAAHLRCGPSSVIALGAAARVQRLAGLPPEMPYVDVLLPRGRHPRPDLRLRLHIAALAPGEVVRLRGLPVTAPARTLADLLLRIPEDQALSLLDSALHQGVLPDLAEVDRAVRYRPGADRARCLLPLADGRAASALESVSRLDCIRGGVPPDDLKYRLLDGRGRQLARTDFCWHRGLRRPLLGDADGRGGGGSSGGRRLPPGDYRLLRFTWADASEPGRVAGLVRTALEELRIRPQPARSR
ncbi:type IV toxin-antitoxin system AbiEi family antitoxin domain-containing protein [Streptacidiphilus sp. N1-3]|uniref:Type IV toxin-antitoxin system AbiEi family antitoxin domain-containing protein n=1 Tax=Streptacidiphilus alkalitolerans TaxID=3342712 RepID=A0ABV6WYK3_9ACTN